jgi:hypothetical protein
MIILHTMKPPIYVRPLSDSRARGSTLWSPNGYMASEKWSNPTVCLVPMSWPTEYARHLDVRTTSIYPLPKMSPDRALAEEAGLDGWKVINRMADAGAEDTGHLGGLAKALNLSEAEKIELAFAYTFERRAGKVRAGEQHE